MKTSHIVVGAVAIIGAVWLYRRRQTSAAAAPTVTDSTGKIPLPQSEATKILKYPDSLLENTSGNTGIIPPVLKLGPTPVKFAQPITKPILQQTNLQGYYMN